MRHFLCNSINIKGMWINYEEMKESYGEKIKFLSLFRIAKGCERSYSVLIPVLDQGNDCLTWEKVALIRLCTW